MLALALWGALVIGGAAPGGGQTPGQPNPATGPTPTPASTPASTPTPTPSPAPANAADTLKKQLDFDIDDPRVTVGVTMQGDRTLVTLTGDLNTEQEARDIVALATARSPRGAQIRPRFFIKHPTDAPSPEPEITDLWVLTYIRSRVTPTGGVAAAIQSASTPDNIDLLVLALNQIYGSPGKLAVQRAGGGRLLLRGTESRVLEIKRFLALIDAPWPQVQMNLWAVQVSGSPADVAFRVRKIGEQVRLVRDQMQDVQRQLAQIVVSDRTPESEHWKFVREQFDKAGVDLPMDGPLSLNESLILLTLHPERKAKVEMLNQYLKGQMPAWSQQWTANARPETARARYVTPDAKQTPPREPFQRLLDLFTNTSYDADRRGFFHFRDALYCFKDNKKWRDRPDAPSSLVRTGAVVDRTLKSVMDAFAADMAETFLDPLLDRLQSVSSMRREDGIALIGRSRIVVTSGLEAGLSPEMASFVESGRPKPFGQDLLNLAFPSSQSGDSTKPEVLTGTSKVLAGLPDAQALGLAAVLLAETEPAYTKVAPGISVNIRPSVLPDGGAARLTIDARFGVASTPLDETRKDVWRQAPPAGVSSHDVRTDATVSAFDLFDISSFSVTASHPQAPFYIPILGRLPLIGQAFQFPRPNKETEFESLVLVNTVILPRSLELHRFYGRETDLPVDPEIEAACRAQEPVSR